MQKMLILILALISLSVQARANWNPYSMNHERFVHLSEEDKRAVIISTMELMVELESKYQHEVKTTGFSFERFQKYVHVIQKFQNLIFNNAYAAASPEATIALTKLADQFSDLLKTLGSNGCVIGGYISIMGKTNGVPYCRHPSTLGKKAISATFTKEMRDQELAVKKAYLSRDGTCVGPEKISCNPVVFGYQKASTPICVQSSSLSGGKGHNISYECMKKALADPDKQDRIDLVAKAMSENKVAFDKVHSFIFRTCVCADSGINSDYMAYMKPHRTCFGMMNTLRVVNNKECEQVNATLKTDFPDEWQKYFGKQGTFDTFDPVRTTQFDIDYGKLIDQAQVKAICDGTPVIVPVIAPVIIPVVKEEDPKKVWVCETTCKTQAIVASELEAKILCTIIPEKTGWNVTMPGKTESEFKAATATEFNTKEFTVDDPLLTTYSVSMTDPKAEKQDCPVKVATEETSPSCSIVVVNDPDGKKAKATVTIEGTKKGEEAVVVWTGGKPTEGLPNEIIVDRAKGVTTNVSVTFTIKDAPVKEADKVLACSSVIDMLVETDHTKPAYTIKATAEAPLTASVKINAVATVDGEDKTSTLPTGFKISWTRTGAGVAKLIVVKSTEAKSSTKMKDFDDEDKEKDKDEEKNTTEVKGVKDETAKGTPITETRVSEPYESCASLIDDKGVSVAGPSCATIPAIEVPKPVNQNNYGPNNGPVNNGQAPIFFAPKNTAAGGML